MKIEILQDKDLIKLPKKDLSLSEFVKYYSNHNRTETSEYFGISEYSVRELIKILNLGGEEARLKKIAIITNTKNNSFEIKEDDIIISSADSKEKVTINKQDFIEKAGIFTREELAIQYNISNNCVLELRKALNLTSSSKEIQKKKIRRGTNLASNSPESKEKRENTCLKKYGYKSNLSSPRIREQIRQGFFDKYGVYNPAQNEEVKQKIKDTNMKNHNGVWNLQTPEHKKQTKETSILKYGTAHPTQNEQIQGKRKNTCLEKYGKEYYSQTLEGKQKIRETNISRYGVNNYVQQNINNYDIWNDNEKFVNYVSSLGNTSKLPYAEEVAHYFNVDSAAVYHKIKELNLWDSFAHDRNHSSIENEVISMLVKDIGIPKEEIILGDRTILEGKEIDIYLPKYNFGIEVDGIYWHSEKRERYQDHDGRSVYSQNKNLLAEKKGVQIFHIYEHERCSEYNPNRELTYKKICNRIKSILNINLVTIYARKCELKPVDAIVQREFMGQNHIQGAEKNSIIALGLYYNNELVACMCFGHSKYKTKYQYELTRFCTKMDYRIIGGASKLFKNFLKQYAKEGDKIVSYNDISKTNGKVYEKLGFECISINSPNYWWVNTNKRDVRTRYQEQKAGEVKRMHDQGYYRLCDCGTKTWVFTNSIKNT